MAESSYTEVPFDEAGYGTVRAREEMRAVSDPMQVAERARELAASSAIIQRKRSFALALDPRLEGGDIISVTSPDGDITVGVVSALVMPLDDPAGLMRVDVEVMEW